MIYQIGEANNPKESDARTISEDAAIEKASQMARLEWNQPIAVWDESDDIIHLFICGQQFRPA